MNACERNVPIGGHTIIEKACDSAKKVDIKDFKASKGWPDWWKNRHNVACRTVFSEERSCTTEMKSIRE